MTLNQRIAYIKGFADGLKLDKDKDEVKVIDEILNLLEDLTVSVTSIENRYDELEEEVALLQEVCYDDCDDCCDCEECCDYDNEENPLYQVVCPECEEEIIVDEDKLLEGEISCPKCDNTLEFDFSDLFGDEECSCSHCD